MTWNFSLTLSPFCSVLLCLILPLLVSLTVWNSHPGRCPCLPLFLSLSLPQPPFSELGTGSDEFHTSPVVNTQTPPLGPPALPLGSTRGWGGGAGGSAGCSGHPALPQRCSCKFWGLRMGGRDGGRLRLPLTSAPRTPSQGTPAGWKARVWGLQPASS